MHLVFDQGGLFFGFILPYTPNYQHLYKRSKKCKKKDKNLHYYNHIEQQEIIKGKNKIKARKKRSFDSSRNALRLCILWFLSIWGLESGESCPSICLCLLRLEVGVSGVMPFDFPLSPSTGGWSQWSHVFRFSFVSFDWGLAFPQDPC